MENRYIKTHRSRDLNRSVLSVSRKLFDQLSNNRGSKKMNDIFLRLKDRVSISETDFMYAVNFLFMLGVLKYQQETDSLELIL